MPPTLPLYRFDELARVGLSPGRTRRDVTSGSLLRVRPGIYARGDIWRQASPEQRVVARAGALQLVSARQPVFSHETAAAIHGLPLYRADPARVHAIVAPERPGAAARVIRHRGELDDAEIVEVGGLLCTTLERTVADVARTATFEQAAVIADAALHRLCVPRNGHYDLTLATTFRDAARTIARRSPHGISRADRVLDFADGRAKLPGETISRVRIRELGFRRISLQVEVGGPDGRPYYVDIGFDDVGVKALGEFDGRLKYVDGTILDGRSAADVHDREKRREDWIRGRTQRRFARWGWEHLRTVETLGARLAAFGIRPPR